jgi:catechol 2,3-dioxygenase-like lactoylglutathione lyase family enzyme
VPRSQAPRTQSRPPGAISPGGPLALDHVQVAAPPGCEAAARAFYGELLGLAEREKPAVLRDRGGAWFALAGGTALHVGVVESGFAAAAKAHPALRTQDERDLRTLAERLGRAGAPVSWQEPLPGVTARFFTEDPWGNRLELLC